MALPRATDVEYIGSGGSGGSCFGETSAEKIAFWGQTPAIRRAYSSAVHATSAQAVSSSFGATQLATLQEIMKVLHGAGLMASA